jgi:pyruvate kinase
VLALTPKPETARRLALVWGLEPRLGEQPTSLEGLTDDAVQSAMTSGLAEPCQRILILAGTPFGAPGAAKLGAPRPRAGGAAPRRTGPGLRQLARYYRDF